jgi:hypothetical protein
MGIAGFLFFLNKDQSFWAGVMISFIFLKPHLLYLLIIAVLLWSLMTKDWKMLIGIAAGILLPLALAILPNPHMISQYLFAFQNYPPEYWQTATLGTPLRLLFGENLFFIQFLPVIAGLVWFVVFWLRNKKTWHWASTLPWIILVSTATAAYGWVFDILVVGVAIVQIASKLYFQTWTTKVLIIVVSFWVISFLNAFLNMPQHWFWWLASAFLVLYILADQWLLKPQRGHIRNENIRHESF